MGIHKRAFWHLRVEMEVVKVSASGGSPSAVVGKTACTAARVVVRSHMPEADTRVRAARKL